MGLAELSRPAPTVRGNGFQRLHAVTRASRQTRSFLMQHTSRAVPPQASGGARIEGHGLYDDTSGPGPQLMTAGTLSSDKVVNRAGESLGEIEDIMLDVGRGRIAYAVMGSGGFLGLGEKLFAIPWNALTLDTDRHCFVLDVAKEHFRNAPGFDKAHWPESAGEEWHREVHAFYRTPLYWE